MAKKAMVWIMSRSSASLRLGNLLQLWRAVIDVDLAAWRRTDTPLPMPTPEGTPAKPVRPHGNTLIDILEEPLVRMLRSGTPEVRVRSCVCACIRCMPFLCAAVGLFLLEGAR